MGSGELNRAVHFANFFIMIAAVQTAPMNNTAAANAQSSILVKNFGGGFDNRRKITVAKTRIFCSETSIEIVGENIVYKVDHRVLKIVSSECSGNPERTIYYSGNLERTVTSLSPSSTL